LAITSIIIVARIHVKCLHYRNGKAIQKSREPHPLPPFLPLFIRLGRCR
jgi:hypothetical protein